MNNIPQKPVLRKVKRPVNHIPHMNPVNTSAQTTPKQSFNKDEVVQSQIEDDFKEIKTNPFVQQNSEKQQKAADNNVAFDLDSYLDDGNLPSTNSKNDVYAQNQTFLQENEIEDENTKAYKYGENLHNNELPDYLTKNVLMLIGAAIFFIGIICAKLFFNDSKVVRNGLQGVVVNQEVPKGRARCGVAERTQGCVLYIMNPQRQEMMAKNFYDLAAKMTGRQRFVIETGNMRYANTRIRPGEIVQLNIPPL